MLTAPQLITPNTNMHSIPLSEENLNTAETADLISKLTGQAVKPSTIAAWRGWRPQALPFIKGLGRRIHYQRADVEAFVKSKAFKQVPAALAETGKDRLLPAPALLDPRVQAPAEQAHLAFLLHEKGAHAAHINAVLNQAGAALARLVQSAGRDAVAALAVAAAAAKRGGDVASVTAADLADAARAVTAQLEAQRAMWSGEKAAEHQLVAEVRARRQPLREAVGARIDQIIKERDTAAAKRDALARAGTASFYGADLIRAGIPSDKLAAVRAALGEPPDISAEVDALNTHVHELGLQRDKLKNFLTAPPGSYADLEGFADFAALIAADRAALEV